MQAQSEKRSNESQRVPMQAWVELSAGESSKRMFASALNISPRGLLLRATEMPEVGSQYVCKFDCPPREHPIEVDAQVVWTRLGEAQNTLGLRFTHIRYEDAAAIEEYVRSSSGPEGVTQEKTLSLYLDGIATPIEARVVEHADEWIIAEQELPFLQLGRGVTVRKGDPSGQRGKIRSVKLHMEGQVPKLVLGVFDLESVRTELAEAMPQPVRLESETTWPDLAPPSQEMQTLQALNDEESPLEDALLAAANDFAAAHEHVDSAPPNWGIEEVVQVPVWNPQDDESYSASADAIHKMTPWAVRARQASIQAKIALSRGFEPVQVFVRRVRVLVQQVILQREPALTTEKRVQRITTPAPKAKTALRHNERVMVESKKTPYSRSLLMGGGLAVGLGILFVALLSEGDEKPSTTEQIPSRVTSIPISNTPAAATQDNSVPPAIPPSENPSQLAPANPSASPQATEPVQPSARQDWAPATPIPTSMQEVAPSSASRPMTFGAASVPQGRSFLIRMSRPITTIQGSATQNGFSVAIAGSLALDRAGPIASAHRSVQSATIVNRGDRSELTILFAQGHKPRYRVIARGSALEIIIEA